MIDLDALVPDCYADYRPLIADALTFFLARLSPQRRTALLAGQARLGAGAAARVRAFEVLRACPSLHKLGQILARHRELDPDFRRELQRLESLPPSATLDDVRAAIAAELGDTAERVTLTGAPLAEGSIALIVPFTLDGDPGDAEHPATDGVFKVLRPGIRRIVEEELAIAAPLGDYLEARSAELGLPPLPYAATFDQIRDMLVDEMNLEGEREHLATAARMYRHDAAVHIPRLLPGSTPRLTAMERVWAEKITDAQALPADTRQRLAHTLVRALLARPFFSDTDDALFHGDPHAGNLLLGADGRVVILDWSLAGNLARADRRALVALLLGALTLDRRRAAAGLGTLLVPGYDAAQLDAALRAAMDGIPWRRLPDFAWLIALLDGLARDGFAFRAELTLFRKSLFTLRGVLRDLSEEASLEQPLALSGANQFAREYASRMLFLYGRRSFGTHLTNADLARLGVRWPVTAARYWLGGLRELARRVRR